MLAMTPFGGTSLGATSAETYAAAQIVANALARDDDNSWTDAFTAMSTFVGDDLTQVVNKAIALGADPGTVQTLAAAQQPSETIYVTGTAPATTTAPKTTTSPAMATTQPRSALTWLALALGLGAAGYGIYRWRKG